MIWAYWILRELYNGEEKGSTGVRFAGKSKNVVYASKVKTEGVLQEYAMTCFLGASETPNEMILERFGQNPNIFRMMSQYFNNHMWRIWAPISIASLKPVFSFEK